MKKFLVLSLVVFSASAFAAQASTRCGTYEVLPVSSIFPKSLAIGTQLVLGQDIHFENGRADTKGEIFTLEDQRNGTLKAGTVLTYVQQLAQGFGTIIYETKAGTKIYELGSGSIWNTHIAENLREGLFEKVCVPGPTVIQ